MTKRQVERREPRQHGFPRNSKPALFRGSDQFVVLIEQEPEQRRMARRSTSCGNDRVPSRPHVHPSPTRRRRGVVAAMFIAAFVVMGPSPWWEAASPPHRPIRRASGANAKSLFLLPASPLGITAFAASRHCRTLRASLGIQSDFTRYSVELQSDGQKNSYMDQCTFGAVRPWGGRGAVRKAAIPESRASQGGDRALLQSNALQRASGRP
jgi:hypothetical protein